MGTYFSTLIILTANHLEQFKVRDRPTFLSATQMLGWMDALPSGPTWQSTTLEVPGCTTTRPIRLLWRNAREIVEDILRNPIFANYMTFDPHIVMRASYREYGEFFTGNRAHHIQVIVGNNYCIVVSLVSGSTPRRCHHHTDHNFVRQDYRNASHGRTRNASGVYDHRKYPVRC